MKKINESFVCLNCGKEVSLAQKTCRNHCNFCFTSKHVDGDMPGDRATDCEGEMFPIEYKTTNGQIKILFECVKCGKKHWNKSLEDDEISVLDSRIEECKIKFI